jgi:hypothetical protein
LVARSRRSPPEPDPLPVSQHANAAALAAHGTRAAAIFPHRNPQKLLSGKPVPDLSGGVVTGPSILLSAVHLLIYMGFSELYVIGCDLDYESTGPYFFRLDELDMANEQNPDIVARRQDMPKVNEQFAILRTHLERSGGRICNTAATGRPGRATLEVI